MVSINTTLRTNSFDAVRSMEEINDKLVKKSSLITSKAEEALEQYKASQLTFSHTMKKNLFFGGAYASRFATEVGLGIVVAANLGLDKKAVINVGLLSVTSFIGYRVFNGSTNKASLESAKAAISDYNAIEEKNKGTAVRAIEEIKVELKTAYDKIAADTLQRFKKLQHYPEQVVGIKEAACELQIKMSDLKAQLSRLPLTSQDIETILSSLESSMREITGDIPQATVQSQVVVNDWGRGQTLGTGNRQQPNNLAPLTMGFHVPTSHYENRYNARLLAFAKNDDAVCSIGIPAQVRTLMVDSEKAKLPLTEKIKAGSEMILKGLGGLVVGAYASSWALYFANNHSPIIPFTVGVGVAGGLATPVYRNFIKTNEQANAQAEEKRVAAFNELKGYYDGMATYLKESGSSLEATSIAEKLKAKLPTVNAYIASLKVETTEGKVMQLLTTQIEATLKLPKEHSPKERPVRTELDRRPAPKVVTIGTTRDGGFYQRAVAATVRV